MLCDTTAGKRKKGEVNFASNDKEEKDGSPRHETGRMIRAPRNLREALSSKSETGEITGEEGKVSVRERGKEPTRRERVRDATHERINHQRGLKQIFLCSFQWIR